MEFLGIKLVVTDLKAGRRQPDGDILVRTVPQFNRSRVELDGVGLPIE
jgi:hypothetical protein